MSGWLCLALFDPKPKFVLDFADPSLPLNRYVRVLRYRNSIAMYWMLILLLLVNRRQALNHHVSRPPGTAPAVPSTCQSFSVVNMNQHVVYSTSCVSSTPTLMANARSSQSSTGFHPVFTLTRLPHRYALTEIKGVGRRYANIVCKKADVDLKKR